MAEPTAAEQTAPSPRTDAGSVAARIEICYGWRLAGLRNAEIYALAAEQWGVKSRQVDTYLAKGREQAAEILAARRDEMVVEQLATLRELYRVAMTKGRDGSVQHLRLARELMADIRQMVGLNAPAQFEVRNEHHIDPASLSTDEMDRLLAGIDAPGADPGGTPAGA